MKRAISISLAMLLLAVLAGCAANFAQPADAAQPTGADSSETNALTVRIVNQSGVELFELAAWYDANGKTLGSMASQRLTQLIESKNTETYVFAFTAAELPCEQERLETFRLDVFAAEQAGEDFSACGGVVLHNPRLGETYTLTLSGDEVSALRLCAAEPDDAVEVIAPEGSNEDADDAEPQAADMTALVGPWRLADDIDLGALSDVFPGAAEFGSGMEIRSNGEISWYIGADGASGTCVIEGNTLNADVTGELDGEAQRVALDCREAGRITMTFKGAGLVWVSGEGESPRGED